MSTTNYFPSGGEGWDRLHAGPLSCHVDDYAVWLADQGYARDTGRQKLRLVGQFSHWMGDRALDLSAVDEKLLERFRISRSRLGKATASVSSDGRQFLTWLRDTARLAPVEREPSHDDPVMETVQRYERFLIEERGVSPKTVLAYLSTVRDFLGDCFESRCQDLGSLDCSHLNGFIRQSCRTQCSATTRVHVAALRSFARYLYRSGIVTADIADGMCRVSTWRLANLPTALAPDQVEAMLASCNRRRVRGERGKRLLRQRGEKLERGFAHLLETGGLRRVSVRGQQNILKRMLVHAAASNLGLLMRHRHGIGTPRSLQGLAAASMATVGQAATAVYLSMFLRLGRLVRLVSSIFGPTRPGNRISPLRTVIQRKDPGTAKIGPKAISATGC